MTTLTDLPTPALLVDLDALDHNIEVMARARPGRSLRPHVKAFKSTALARHVHGVGGHDTFCCATLREMEGMVAAGLHTDLLLANETLDAARLTALVASSPGLVTVAVDSPETVAVAALGGRVGADRRRRRSAPVRLPARARRLASPSSRARSASRSGE